jgi:hypothetical protein
VPGESLQLLILCRILPGVLRESYDSCYDATISDVRRILESIVGFGGVRRLVITEAASQLSRFGAADAANQIFGNLLGVPIRPRPPVLPDELLDLGRPPWIPAFFRNSKSSHYAWLFPLVYDRMLHVCCEPENKI